MTANKCKAQIYAKGYVIESLEEVALGENYSQSHYAVKSLQSTNTVLVKTHPTKANMGLQDSSECKGVRLQLSLKTQSLKPHVKREPTLKQVVCPLTFPL